MLVAPLDTNCLPLNKQIDMAHAASARTKTMLVHIQACSAHVTLLELFKDRGSVDCTSNDPRCHRAPKVLKQFSGDQKWWTVRFPCK